MVCSLLILNGEQRFLSVNSGSYIHLYELQMSVLIQISSYVSREKSGINTDNLNLHPYRCGCMLTLLVWRDVKTTAEEDVVASSLDSDYEDDIGVI